MDTPTFAWKLFELLSPILLAGLAWLAMKAGQLFNAKTRTEQVARALLLVDDAVLVAARGVQQVLVDQLKATSREGSLTPEQRAQAKQAAMESARSQLGPQGLADVASTLGLDANGVEQLLGARIEAAVHRLRQAARIAADTGTAGDAVPFAA
jgi:hypothetical protein